MLLDLVLEQSASERTKARRDNLVVCNLSGKPSGGLCGDKVIEILVRAVKDKLRNIHGNMKAEVIDKLVSSMSTMNKIIEHDEQSMGTNEVGIQSSFHYIDDAKIDFIKKTVEALNPFSKERAWVNFHDKVFGISPFSGMTVARLENFLKKKRANYLKHHPCKIVISSPEF